MKADTNTMGDAPANDAKAPHLAVLPGHLIRRAQQVHNEMWARIVSGSISSVQYAVLSTVTRYEPVDQAIVARLVVLDKASTHAVAHRLKSAGYLEMTRSIVDGRRHELKLTEDGRRLCRELEPRVESLRRALNERLPSDDSRVLFDLLAAFINTPIAE